MTVSGQRLCLLTLLVVSPPTPCFLLARVVGSSRACTAYVMLPVVCGLDVCVLAR